MFEQLTEEVFSLLAELREEDQAVQKRILTHLISRIEVMDGQIQRIIPHDWAKPFF